MDSVVLIALRAAVLIVLWLFVIYTLLSLRRDTNAAAIQPAATPVATPAVAAPTPRAILGRGEKARTLRIVDGPLNGSHLAISTVDSVVLGRNPNCDFVLGDDYSSARHARLFRRGNEWFIEDLDSRNGTWVDGFRIDAPEKVSTDSEIKIGRTTVRLLP